MSTPHRASHRRSLAVASLLFASLAGCATAPRGPAQEVQWPLPPDKPRVKWLHAVKDEGDLERGLLTKLGRIFVPASPDAKILQPTGLAFSTDEKRLYVSSGSQSKVVVVDLTTGTIRPVADAEGRRPSAPTTVAVDAADNLFVADPKGNSIWVYGPDGDFLRRISHDKLEHPTTIAIDRKAQVIYAVCGVLQKSQSHRVEVFSLKGEHLRTIGTRGAGPGEFNFPGYLAVAPDGNLFVVDTLNFRVQIIDPEGKPMATFGSIGAGLPGTFDKAKGIAFDTFGNVYVADSQQGYVQIFNPNYQPLMAFGGRVKLPGYMAVPTAVAIDSRNRIYVADYGRSEVNVYQLVNTTAEDAYATEAGQNVATPPPPAPPPAASGPQ